MAMPKRLTRGRSRPTPGVMNKLEQAYALELDGYKAADAIVEWWYEPIKLRLAKRTWYTPDFMVQHADGTLEFVEVKGRWEDDARVKIKVAAEKYWPFFMTAIQKASKKDGGGWTKESFGISS